MSSKKTYAVFGLGRYGRSVAMELCSNGAEVLAVDINEEKVNNFASVIPYCKCADVTDPETIRHLGISNMDVVVISMATNLEASVMATMLCKEAGVKTVIAKCSSEMNCKILEKVGADRVIFPESESGIRLAKNLVSSGFVDILDISNDVSMVELEVRTSEDSVDIDAESTRMTTIAIRRSGSPESMVGMTESNPFALMSIWSENSLPKPPRK